MLVTMLLITALLAGAVVLSRMQLVSTRSADVSRQTSKSFNCAEAGVVTARSIVASSFNRWDEALATYPSTTEPQWLKDAIGSHDLDGDSNDDFEVYLLDNEDETLGPLDPTHNNDLQVFIVSRCITTTDYPKEVRELIEFNGGTNAYESQTGGATSANNRTQ
jgi:hypothetical protein